MPKVLIQKARNDIYRQGLDVPSKTTKSGFRKNRAQPANEQDTVLIEKGQTYYMWSFPFGGTYRQLTAPTRSQLTLSSFLSQWYSMQDSVATWNPQDLEGLRLDTENLTQELRDLGEEQEEKLNNMPEQLQESDSGEILRERADGLEEIADVLDDIDWDIEDDDGETLTEKLSEVEEALNNANF